MPQNTEKLLCGRFCTKYGNKITMPMQTVSVSGTVNDILTTFTIKQTFCNDSTNSIEARYEFPVPLNATLLGFEAQFGDRKLKSIIQTTDSATAEYKVLEAGNGPILLETKHAKKGQYQASFGDLKPGETAIIEYRYAMQHTWNGRILYLHVPTIIDLHDLGEPKDCVSGADSVGNFNDSFPLWQFVLDVSGILANSSITCTTHPLQVKPVGDCLQVTFATLPQHDLVLRFECENRPESVAVCDRDRDGWIVAADFMPRILNTENSNDLNLDILLNCSEEIGETAKQGVVDGVMRILNSLGSNDFFNIIHEMKGLFDTRRPANSENIAQAKYYVEKLLEHRWEFKHPRQAFESVCAIQGGAGPRSILLISNGFQGGRKFREKITDSGCRIMTVLLGDKRERFLNDVLWCTEDSGGTCVTPSSDEEVPGCIYKHYMRIRVPATEKEFVVANVKDYRKGHIATVEYDGDTIHAFARYTDKPSGDFRMQASLYGYPMSLTCAITEPVSTDTDTPLLSDLARIAAASRLQKLNIETDKKIASQLAVDYQLLSHWTRCLLIGNSKRHSPPESVERWFESVTLDSYWGWIGHGSIVMVDMGGEIKHCFAHVTGGSGYFANFSGQEATFKTITLHDLESADRDECLISFQQEEPKFFCDDEDSNFLSGLLSEKDLDQNILGQKEQDDCSIQVQQDESDVASDEEDFAPAAPPETFPYSQYTVCHTTELDLHENLPAIRKWIRCFISGHTDEQNRIAQQNTLRLLGGETSDTAMLVSSIFQDYLERNTHEVECYYDALEKTLRYSRKEKLRFRDVGDILLCNDMRVKVVFECNYDPESDETKFTLCDLYTGEMTTGYKERNYECILLGDVRYYFEDDVKTFYDFQKDLFSSIAEIVYYKLLFSNNEASQNVDILVLNVTENLFNAVSKYLYKEDIPAHDVLLKAVREAFMQIGIDGIDNNT